MWRACDEFTLWRVDLWWIDRLTSWMQAADNWEPTNDWYRSDMFVLYMLNAGISTVWDMNFWPKTDDIPTNLEQIM